MPASRLPDLGRPACWAQHRCLALIGGLVAEKRIAWIPLVSCVITIPMSVLTVVFHDATFVKIKMTIVDVLIGGILLGALVLKKQPLKAAAGRGAEAERVGLAEADRLLCPVLSRHGRCE